MFCKDGQWIAAIDTPEQYQVALEEIMDTNELHPCVLHVSGRVHITRCTPRSSIKIEDWSCREIIHAMSTMKYLYTKEALKDLEESLWRLREASTFY